MNSQIKPSERIIIALDGLETAEVIPFLKKIPNICWVKVGLELFMKAGPDFVTILRDQDKRIFLDLKFHDIPNTMSNACRQAAKSGAELITVHACSGSQALLAAKEAAIEGATEVDLPAPTLLAVTVLTSWRNETFSQELSLSETINKRVQRMAELAFKAGIGGCICSPLEVALLRQKYPEPFQLITPGIRLEGEDCNDQARVLTPLEAVKAGASKLVIGRPITNASNPSEAFEKFCDALITKS